MRRTLATIAFGVVGFILAVFIAGGNGPTTATAASSGIVLPPSNGNGVTLQWYWQIGSTFTTAQLAKAPVSTANIVDVDMFETSAATVSAIHAANKYAIGYIEAGAQQAEPDSACFQAADYTNASHSTQMQGYAAEHWFNTNGFAGWSSTNPTVYPGTGGNDASANASDAANIASCMSARIAQVKSKGFDAIEPDDLDGYTNPSQDKTKGGGWALSQQAAAGYEAWLAYTAHQAGLAAFQKNDGANTSVDEPQFDGMIIEECNYYKDPCTGSSGDDVNAYVSAGKPVLNAEYKDDGETTAKFCSADASAGMTGALFNVDLDGKTYQPCVTGSGYSYGGAPVTSTTSSTPTTTTATTTQTTTTPPNCGTTTTTTTRRHG